MKELDKIRISGEQQISRNFLWLKPKNNKYEILRPKGRVWDKVLIDGVYTKPDSGIPIDDLNQSIQSTLESVPSKQSFTKTVVRKNMGVYFLPDNKAFIITAYDGSNTNAFFVECPDDPTNVIVTALHNNTLEEQIVDFYCLEGQMNALLVWNNTNSDIDIVLYELKGNTVQLLLTDEKPSDDYKYTPSVFLRPENLSPIIVSGTIEQYGPEDPIEPRDFFPDRTYSEGEFEELKTKIDRVVLNFEGIYVKVSGYDSTSIYCSTPGIGFVQWNKPSNQ